ncbi:MAG: RNA pseudouridine synthase, partial [Burkholderiaceae bacterium]|nr:RNA pseudouridine synthase [Burkholderiaceae bacterium]
MSIRSESPADGVAPIVHADDPLILHRDDALIVLCKPSGLLAVPGRGALLQDCAALRVQRAFPEARVVHRL